MWGTAFFLRFRLLPPLITVGGFSFLAASTLVSLACVDGGRVTGLLRLDVQEFDSTFVLTYPDFNWDSLHPVEPPPAERQIGNLFYRAEVIPEDTSLDSDPMSLWITVRVRNPTDQSVELPVQGCTVWPEVYGSPARSEEPVWAPEGVCAQQPYSVWLAPGATREFSFLAYDAMLGGNLPDGRYYFNALFRQPDDTLVLPAGSGDVRLRVPGLAYRVRLRSEDREAVRAEVTVINRNEQRVRVTFGHCASGMKLYRDDDRQEPVPQGGSDRVCLLYLAVRDVEPGDSLLPDEFARSFSLSDLVEGRLEQGRYFVSVSLGHNWRTYEFPAGVLTLY
jgi:hypothetical protein